MSAMSWGVATGAGQRRELSMHELSQRFVLSLRGIAQLRVDAHVRTVELHPAHRFRKDEIAARVGVDQRVQSVLDVGLGSGTWNERQKRCVERESLTKKAVPSVLSSGATNSSRTPDLGTGETRQLYTGSSELVGCLDGGCRKYSRTRAICASPSWLTTVARAAWPTRWARERSVRNPSM